MISRLNYQIIRTITEFTFNNARTRLIINPKITRSLSFKMNGNPSTLSNRRMVHKKCPSSTSTRKKKKEKVEEEDLTVWEQIFGPRKKKKNYPKECCKYLASQKPEFEEIPEFVMKMQEPGTTITKKGRAYILEIPHMIKNPKERTKEQELVDKMGELRHKKQIEDVCNPMPHFTTVGKRLIDLQERKLHPLYKRYEMLPKSTKKWTVAKPSCARPVHKTVPPSKEKKEEKPEIIVPKQKDLYWEYKMTELPKQVINRTSDPDGYKPCALDVKKDVKRVCKEKGGPKHIKKCPPDFCY